MDIHTMIIRRGLSKLVKGTVDSFEGEWNKPKMKARVG
jgi:hypothetical protein